MSKGTTLTGNPESPDLSRDSDYSDDPPPSDHGDHVRRFLDLRLSPRLFTQSPTWVVETSDNQELRKEVE